MKRICIVPGKMGKGGPASFLRKLVAGLEVRNIQTTYDLDDTPFDTILVINGTRNIAKLYCCKKRGIRIVQRLGVPNVIYRYRPFNWRLCLASEMRNVIMRLIRKFLADHVIYQSRFVKEQWNKKYGPAEVATSTIYNGVDLSEFCPEGNRYQSPAKVCIISVEGGQGGDPFDIVIRLGKELVEKNMDIEILMFGTSWNNAHKRFSQHSFINFIGSIPSCELSYFYRGADIFISADILTAGCPNSVLEALSCGLPVLGYDTGVLPELLNESSGQCVDCDGNPFIRGQTPGNLKGMGCAAMKLLDDRDQFRQGARRLAEERYGLEQMVDKYIEVLLGSQ